MNWIKKLLGVVAGVSMLVSLSVTALAQSSNFLNPNQKYTTNGYEIINHPARTVSYQVWVPPVTKQQPYSVWVTPPKQLRSVYHPAQHVYVPPVYGWHNVWINQPIYKTESYWVDPVYKYEAYKHWYHHWVYKKHYVYRYWYTSSWWDAYNWGHGAINHKGHWVYTRHYHWVWDGTYYRDYWYWDYVWYHHWVKVKNGYWATKRVKVANGYYKRERYIVSGNYWYWTKPYYTYYWYQPPSYRVTKYRTVTVTPGHYTTKYKTLPAYTTTQPITGTLSAGSGGLTSGTNSGGTSLKSTSAS